MTWALTDLAEGSGWPDNDTIVLRSRPLRPGTDPTTLSRFGHDIWHIKPAHPDAHINISPLRWEHYPAELRATFKVFFLAALDHPSPGSPDGARPGERTSVGTFNYWFADLLVFAHWLIDRGTTQLSALTADDLELYRAHILALDRPDGRKSDMLSVIRTFWLYRRYMPEPIRLRLDYPWKGMVNRLVVGLPGKSIDNKTPRIDHGTMTALLAWSLRVVEDFGPDIANAWIEYRQLDTGVHPSQEGYHGTLATRLPVLIERLRATGGALPGCTDDTGRVRINYSAVIRMVGIPEHLRAGIIPSHRRKLDQSGLPVTPRTGFGTITGLIDGRPWRQEPITRHELTMLLRMVYVAAFTLICFLSGMRPGEVLNLPLGCRDTDPDTGELLIIGRRGKGFDRSPLSAESEPQRPWVVVAPVHTAIELLESLGIDSPFLFPSSPIHAHATRPASHNARSGASITLDLHDFQTWINTTFQRTDGVAPIPADPTKHLHANRFRRTLAYFIVRRPRGLIAAALQYGHVNTKVTLSYAGRSDTSWLDDIAVERLEMTLDQIRDDTAHLANGEHVSGPAAIEYRARITRAAAFAGRTVTSVRNVERLLNTVDLNIHHGEAITCVWRAETAACRQAKLAAGLPTDGGPDESECRSACRNLAYTDRDIAEQRARQDHWTSIATDHMAPKPLRDRAAALAAAAQTIIDHHQSEPSEETT